MIHRLKAWPEFFEPLRTEEKTFEIRKNDRGYKVGDVLIISEFDPSKPDPEMAYTGRTVTRLVTYVTSFPDGLRDGYVCLGLRPA